MFSHPIPIFLFDGGKKDQRHASGRCFDNVERRGARGWVGAVRRLRRGGEGNQEVYCCFGCSFDKRPPHTCALKAAAP